VIGLSWFGRSLVELKRGRVSFAPVLVSLIIGLSIGPSPGPALADQNQVISLNNDGVKALNSGNIQLAIQKFQQALQLDPNYKLARDNLAIAHNNYGLQLRTNPKEALKEFHQALYLNPDNGTTLSNVEGIIRMMGKNPRSFADRVALGEDARHSSDFVGAIIEFSEALKIKDDPKLHIELGDIYRVKDESEKAINQYKLAAQSDDNADIEVKIGQAYQSKNDLPNAIQAYGKAIGFKSDDPDVQDALVAGWEGALRAEPLAPENHIGLAQAYQYRGDFGQARQELLQALRLAGNRSSQAAQTAQRLLSALPQAEKQASINKHINSGVDLQSRKLYDAAIQEYKLALQADPNNVDVHVNLGTAYQAKEDYDSALSEYNRVLQMDPKNEKAQQGIKTAGAAKQDRFWADTSKSASDLFKQGKYDEAVQQYEQLLKINPRDAAAHFDLGATLQAKKDYDAAISEYRTALSIDQANPQYQKALADAMDQKVEPIIEEAVKKHQDKDYGGAIALYQQALGFKPSNAGLWFNLASAQYSRQDYQRAREAYSKALEIDRKGQINDLYFIAAIDDNFGRGADALAEYKKYFSEAPQGTYAQSAKERVAALSKDASATVKIKSDEELARIKEATDSYQKAVQLQQQQQFDEAIPFYQKAISLQPQESSYAYGLGTLYQQKKDMDQAVTWYQKAKDLDPTNKDYTRVLGEAFNLKADPMIDQAVQKQTSGDLAGALQLYGQASLIAPKNARLWTDMGTALQQSDKFQEALDAYQKGYDLDNKNEVGDLYLMGVLNENFGQGNQAYQNYQKYVSQAPSGQYVAQAKARIKALAQNVGATQKLATAADQKAQKAAQDAYDQGVKLQEGKQYDEAIASYQQAIQANPKESAFSYALGTAYQAKGDFDNAMTWYQKAIAQAPQNATFKKAFDDARDLKAAPIMDEAVKKHTGGDLTAAIELYQKGLAINPDNPHGWTNMAAAYQAADDFVKARESYQKALELDGKGEADNLYFIALLDENSNLGSKALQEYQRYLISTPRGTYSAQAQQRVSQLKANPNSTQKIVTATEQKKSGEAQGAYDNAVKLQQDNKLDDALAEYKKAIAAQPTEPSFYYSIGTCYQAKNDLDLAIENYRKAAEMNPKEPAYKQALKGVTQLKAQPLVDSAIKKQTTKNEKGEYDNAGAIADYDAALKIDDDASTHMNLGTAYQAVANYSRAAGEYKRALQMDAKAAVDCYYYLGTLYEATKQPSMAVEEYQKYLRAAPSGANATECRSRVKELAPGRR
jgi:tetratricopeptide (TPR) repeat protein